MEGAEWVWGTLRSSGGRAGSDEAQATVSRLGGRWEKAQEGYEPYVNKPEDNLTRAARSSGEPPATSRS